MQYKISPSFSIPVIDVKATSENLKRLREDRGIKVRVIQKMFGMEYPQAIYSWENPDDKTLPRLDNLVTLAKIYGVSMDEIIVIKTEETSELSVCEPPPYREISKSTLDFITRYSSLETKSALERHFGFSLMQFSSIIFAHSTNSRLSFLNFSHTSSASFTASV